VTFQSLARRLPDELWEVFEPLLPPVVWCGNGRPPRSNRECLHAALFILMSGTPWKLMPPGFPCYKTVYGRFKQWVELGVFHRAWAGCAARYQELQGINFDQLSIDGARKAAKKGVNAPAPTQRTGQNAGHNW
jgi:transposase